MPYFVVTSAILIIIIIKALHFSLYAIAFCYKIDFEENLNLYHNNCYWAAVLGFFFCIFSTKYPIVKKKTQ